MVQQPPYWRANCTLGHINHRKFKFSCFVLDVPVCNLLSNMAVFVPCDHQFQTAHCTLRNNPSTNANPNITNMHFGLKLDHVYFVHPSTDISVNCRSTYRPMLDQELLSDSRPTCRSIGYRHSADTSLPLAYLVLVTVA